MSRGLLIVLSGPSGVGKGTIRKRIQENPKLNLAFSTSMTTRKPRPGEVDGVDYFFKTEDQFNEAVKNGELLEHTVFVGNQYGTPVAEVERLRNEGKNVLLEIEVDGATQVHKKCPDAVSIFVTPPSMEELESRIRHRSTEPEEIIQQRLTKAENEMKLIYHYKYVVCNEDVELAAKIIEDIILRHVELESRS
ncbi:MAG: guanylate kinase [Faecalicoccus sp.]|nr:guanylate kinase [Faecalicoccus sp.]